MTNIRNLDGTSRSSFQVGLGGPLLKNNANSFDLRNAADTAFAKLNAAEAALTQAAATSGTPAQALAVTGGAHTGLAASTEALSVDFAVNQTVQFATGALTTQRAARFRPPTYAFVAASTITNAATLAIEDAPQAGTNATITNAFAFWVQAGRTQFDGDVRFSARIFGPNGSNNQPTYAFLNSAATGMYRPAANQIGFACSSTATAVWTSTLNTFHTPIYVDDPTGANFNIAYALYPGNSGMRGDSLGKAFLLTAGIDVVTIGTDQSFAYAQSVATSGSPGGFSATFGAHTGLTANSQVSDFKILNNRTVQFAAGTIALQRSMALDRPTYGFTAAGTITQATTLGIRGAPLQGTNATLTTSYAVFVNQRSDTSDCEMVAFGTETWTHTIATNKTALRYSQLFAPTIAGSGAVTVTDAATLYVSGAPIQGTNATLTRSFAFWVAGGTTRQDGLVQQKNHANFASSDRFRDTGAVQTTNATQTTLKTWAIADNTVNTFTAWVTARDEAGVDRAGFGITAVVYRQAAGAATLQGAVVSLATTQSTGALTWAATWTVSGNNMLLSVTGALAVTIDWAAMVDYQGVLTSA